MALRTSLLVFQTHGPRSCSGLPIFATLGQALIVTTIRHHCVEMENDRT